MDVRGLITKSLRTIHVLGSDEYPAADDALDALDILNGIIEQANIDKLLGYYQTTVSFPMVVDKSVYTIGPASSTPDITATRPVEVLSAFSRRNNIDHPIGVGSRQDYNDFAMKSAGVAGWEWFLYYEPSFPKASIYLYPVPKDTLTTVFITVMAEVVSYTTIDDVVSLPPGYRTWLQYKAAERLAPEYGFEFTDAMRSILMEAEAAIMRNNIKPMPVITTDVPKSTGKYNIYSDGYK